MEEEPNIQRHFLSGGGEMGERIRNFDWSKTTLGNPETWESSLKTCVRIMLTSPQPMFVWWGGELINIYNDAYRHVLGDKHPAMLGVPGNIVWKEIWEELWTRGRTVFEKNEGTFDDALLLIMNRYGYDEETYFKFSYNPIPGIRKTTEGLFCVCTEETQRIINERALDTLRKLGAIIFTEKSLDIIYRNVAEALASNNKDFPFALIYKITGEANIVTVAASTGIDKSQNVFPDTIDITKPTAITKDFCEAFRQNKMVVSEIKVTDITLPTGAWQTSPTQFIYLPVSPAGGLHPYCIISAALNPYRTFDETYMQFCQLIGDRVSIEINKMLTLEIESKRAEALAEIDRAKIVFFSNISHEFRTPLTLMLGPLETILHEKENNLNKSVKQNIEIAQRNALLLLKLVNTLLDFSNIERGKQQADFSLVDIVSFTKILTANFRSLIEKAGMKLIVKADTQIQPVYVDKQMWQKIVFNLLSNAFKYTLHGKITVEFSSEKDFAVLKIKDTGVGIPEDELPKMFERFHRIENSAGRTYEGTGIGLSLIKELVNLHNGEISVESVLGEGSVFTVKIPFGKEHVKQHQILKTGMSGFEIPVDIYLTEIETLLETENKESIKIADKPENKHNPIILLVDDNADMREYLKSILSQNFKVITAINGRDALKKMKETIPTLVIADIMMPVMDGFGLLKEIKANKITETIPVIFLTALANEDSRIEGWEMGADDYLIKPFSGRELLSRVNAQLKMVKLRQSLQDNLRNVLLQSPVAIAVLKGPQHVFDLANATYLHLTGNKEVVGKSMRQAFPELEQTGIYELLDQVYSTGEPFVANEMLVRLDKGNEKLDEKYFNFVYQPSREINGKIDGVLMHGVDVTEQVLARKKTEESEIQQAYLLKLSDALRSLEAPQKIKYKAMQVLGQHLKVSRCYYAEILKDGKHCIIENSFSSDIGSMDGTYILEDFGKAKVALLQRGEIISTANVANDTSVTQEERDKNLKMQILAYINVPLLKDNKLICLLGVNQTEVRNWTALDLTIVQETAERTWAAVESAKAEEALRRSEEKYRTLFTSIDQGFTLCELIRNNEGKAIDLFILEVNPTYEKQTGVSKEMVIGKPLLQVFPSLDRWMATYAAVVDNQLPMEFEQYFEDTDRWFTIEAYPVEKERFAVLFSDITERKQAEAKIKESETRFRNMADASPVLIWTLDANGRSSYYNKTFLDFIGARQEDDISDWKKIVHPDDFQSTVDTIATAKETNSSYSLENRLLRADGKWRWVMVKGNPIMGSNKEFLGFVGSSVDITLKKENEEALAQQKQLLESVTENTDLSLFLMDEKQYCVYMNKAAEKMTGFTLKELKGEKLHYHVHHTRPDGSPYPLEECPIDRALPSKIKMKGEEVFVHKDGSFYPVAFTASPITFKGNPIGTVIEVKETTEDKRKEQELKESETRFRRIADGSPLLVWTFDANGAPSYYNRTFLDFIGAKDEAISDWKSILHPVDKKSTFDTINTAIAERRSYSLECRLLRADGQWRWVLSQGNPQIGVNNEFLGFVGSSVDISERKQAEQKMQENEKFLELTINSSPSLIFYLDNEMRYRLTNDTFKRWFDAERNEVIGKTMEEFLGNKAWQVIQPYLLLAYRGETIDYETEIDYGLRGVKWIHAVYTPDKDDKGKVKGIVAMVRDITNRKHAEQKIQEGEERLRLATQTSGVGIWEWNIKTNKIRWDSQMFHIYGIAPTADECVDYSTWKNTIAPNDLAEQERTLQKTIKNAGKSKRTFKIFRVNDGMPRDIEAIEAARTIAQGETEWVVGTNMDITEQKRATEKIAENEKQFSTLANNIQNLAWIANGDGWVYWYNQRWYDYTGTTLEEMKGWGWQKVQHPDHAERIVEICKKLWIINEPFELTFPLRRYDGEYRWFLTRAVPINDENGNIISWIGTNTDIHDQKVQEEKKDEFISIASHEMKTPLTTAKAYIQLLELTLDDNEEAMLYAKKASQSVNRLEELTSELLDVSKIRLGKLNYTISTFNFNDMVDSTVENIQLTTSTHTIIKSGNVYDEVTGDKDRLQQVIINLLSNAIKYSPNSKKVFITVEQEKDMIKVSVKDSGIGIASQSLTKIFEKYHRVEEDAVQFQGLGIGLFISFEIIQRHHGKLWAESELGKGSTFYFSLPVSPMKSAS